MDSKNYSINDLRQIISPIAKKYGLEHVYLFGSVARGDYSASSDIDIRVDKGKLRGLFALGGLHSDLTAALGVKVDILTTGSLDEDFLSRIREDEVLLYAGQ